MKTFDQLTPGEFFFKVYGDAMTYTKEEVKKCDQTDLEYGYSEKKIPRFKLPSAEMEVKKDSYYSRYAKDSVFFFVNEADAIRLCKARMMKHLFAKIESAKRAIESVKDFRKEHWELLNHKWTDEQIQKLEIELGY